MSQMIAAPVGVGRQCFFLLPHLLNESGPWAEQSRATLIIEEEGSTQINATRVLDDSAVLAPLPAFWRERKTNIIIINIALTSKTGFPAVAERPRQAGQPSPVKPPFFPFSLLFLPEANTDKIPGYKKGDFTSSTNTSVTDLYDTWQWASSIFTQSAWSGAEAPTTREGSSPTMTLSYSNPSLSEMASDDESRASRSGGGGHSDNWSGETMGVQEEQEEQDQPPQHHEPRRPSSIGRSMRQVVLTIM
jgi:hypothetical protein